MRPRAPHRAGNGAIAERAPEQDQRARIVAEVTCLAVRAGIAVAPGPKPRADRARSVVAAIEWAFRARTALAGIAGNEHWRDSISRLGPPRSDAAGFIVSEYQRSELGIPVLSPLACYYPWLRRPGLRSAIRYTANGMSAIAGFLLGLGQAARHAAQPIKLITTPLYWETRAFLRMWFCQGLFDWECHQSVETLLRAVEHAKGPCAIFLDSSEVLDTVALLHALQCRPAPADLIAVGWDNTCIPIGDAICWSEFAAPLYLLRSHLKLDQLGLEISPLGSMTVVASANVLPAAAGFLEMFLEWSPRYCQLLGVSASADTLRRLHRLGLPDATLTPAHNAGLMRANVVGARRLAELLPAEGRASLRSYPHGCFCTLQLDFPGAPAAHSDGPGTARWLARELHQQAAAQGLPLFNAAGFGFAFTAVQGYDDSVATSGAIPALRIAFGDHDPPVLGAVAELIARVLRETRPHRVS